MIPIGKAIQMLREGKKMSRPQFAVIVGCHRQFVYKVECGYMNPSMSSLERFAKALNLEASKLVILAEAIEKESLQRRVQVLTKEAA